MPIRLYFWKVPPAMTKTLTTRAGSPIEWELTPAVTEIVF